MSELTDIEDYALIGNCRSAALVGKNGSIDWCCLPRFDSPAIFSAILDSKTGGHFFIRPKLPFKASQKYIPDTNVIETIFENHDSVIKIIDAFIAFDEKDMNNQLFPDHEIIRIVEGIKGKTEMNMEFIPKPYYGKYFAQLTNNKKLGINFNWKGHSFTLTSTLSEQQLELSDDKTKATASFNIEEGQKIIFSLSNSECAPSVIPELEKTGEERLKKTIKYWQDWLHSCKYDGVYAGEVRRSILTLKLLTYAPSGAIIAAPTTSLPEKAGGERNWDYRYCWLRDASFSTRVLIKMGFIDEVHAYMNWILHATQLTRPQVQVVYSIFGIANLKEKELSWLSGFKNSSPVRIGNKADQQFQLDVYGEVLDAIYLYSDLIDEFDNDSSKFIVGLGNVICKKWKEPDNGIWEVRSEPKHYTHSKVMAWVGLDKIIKMKDKIKLKKKDERKFIQTTDEIKNEIESKGYNHEIQSYTCEFNGRALDSSLLTISLADYKSSSDNQMLSTVKRIHEELAENDLLYRYKDVEDGMKSGEGAFTICNFWLAENYAKSGRIEEARKVFEAVIRHKNSTCLFSEEINPFNGKYLGNYPQGFTHLGLINAAVTIDEEINKQKPNI